ncbi:MAG: membrane dipeptidase, partial [Labilithrix sp.]|nr:membrane dipeptidase [Labilithrix sp.]
MSNRSRWGGGARALAVGLVMLGVVGLVALPKESSAQSCGQLGQPGCGVFKSDCKAGLILYKGKCLVKGACGADGQRPCLAVPLERIPSCNAGLVELAGTCVKRGVCGDENQRACLVVERVPSCNNKNLVERPGDPAMCVHPPCGRVNQRPCNIVTERPLGTSCDVGLAEVSGRCVDRASLDCGRLGERACTLAERAAIGNRPCEAGLDEAPGCNGECRGSSGRCFNKNLAMTEPGTNMTPVAPTDPMRGFADLHVHMFANLAFGGGVLAGAAYDPAGGAAKALAPDFGTDLDLLLPAGTQQRVGACPPLVPRCGSQVMHGDHIPVIDDFLGVNGDGAKSYFGAPIFSGWPTWRSKTHQQVYYKWVERAWRGGMRAMVMLAVANEFACAVSKRLRGTVCTDSMASVDKQLDAAKAFEAWLNTQPGGGWFKIVKTPDEAEQTIRAGKLAVILGIESDILFDCKPNAAKCTQTYVQSKVDEYYGKGVRYIFPIHDFDTAIGGPALFNDLLGVANVKISGAPFVSAPCPGISDLGTLNCNTKGLSPVAGTVLINKLMDLGMMIDIDHMSAKMIDDVFAIADARGGYPFFVGHGLFNEVYTPEVKNRHERMRTTAQLARLKGYGSLVSVMTEDELHEKQTRCKHSSVSFIQNYDYAVKKMGVVAFGSDFNGMAGHVGPRFGDDACGGVASQKAAQLQTQRLRYPFTLEGFGTFDKQVTGQRTFDFNVDVFAHIGLYPDLLGDLTVQRTSIEPLMRSAAELVATWRRALAKRAGAPAPAPAP